MRTNFIVTFLAFLSITFLFGISPSRVVAQSSIKINVDISEPGISVPEEFIGLSFEMEKLLPDNAGKYFFSPSNKSLLATFKTLGIKSLRVGGNTADRATVKLPAQQGVDSLFAFAKEANVKVIYTLRLRGGIPAYSAKIVTHIMNNYSVNLDCFAIGNEPNVFSSEYEVYRSAWSSYANSVLEKYSGVMYCGPSATPGKSEWAKSFAEDFAGSGLVKYITQHAYPGGSGTKVTNPELGRSTMLSSQWVKSYKDFYNTFAPHIKEKGFSYRIEETNNFFHGGAVDVSNTFASALWGLDYMFWWAQHNVAGINFHTGDSVAAGDHNNPCMYASFVTSENGYTMRPLGYAIKAFDIASKSRFVPVQFTANEDSLNVTAYAVAGSDNKLFITLINKELGGNAKDASVNLAVGENFGKGEVMFLKAPDAAAKTGINLGGSEINDDASWNGTWSPLTPSLQNGEVLVNVPAASVVIVKLSNN